MSTYPPGLTQKAFDQYHNILGDCIPDDDAPLPEDEGQFNDIFELPALSCGHLSEHFVYDPVQDAHICADCAALSDWNHIDIKEN